MAITFLRSAVASNGTAGSPTTLPITVTLNAGETAVLWFGTAASTASPGSFSAVGAGMATANGGPWAQRIAPVTSGNFRMSCWSTDASAATAATTVTVPLSGATDNVIAIVMVYGGVLAIGNTASATGNSPTSSVSLLTQDANDWAAAGHFSATANNDTLTTGQRIVNKVQSSTSTNDAVLAATDNSAATATTVTNAAGLIATEPWAAGALELRSTTGLPPLPTDSGALGGYALNTTALNAAPAAGFNTVTANATMSATSSVAATPTAEMRSGSTISSVASVSASGQRTSRVSSTISVTSTASSGGVRIQVASVATSAVSSVQTTGVATYRRSATLSAVSSAASGGYLEAKRAVVVTSASSAGATAVRTALAPVAISAASGAAATGVRTQSASAALLASSSATASATVQRFVVATATLSATSSLVNAGTSGGTSYGYRRPIVIDHTKVSLTDQVDFPVLLSFTDATLKAVAQGGRVAAINGYDIIVTSDAAGLVKLDHEVERYDATAGELRLWVRVPVLSATVDTTLYLHYGNAAITSSQENAMGVWANGYAAVYHWEKNGALSLQDSTGNNNHATPVTTGPVLNSGQVGGGARFDSSPVVVADSASLDTTTDLTIETWRKDDGLGDYCYFSKDGAFAFRQDSSGFTGLYWWDGSQVLLWRGTTYFGDSQYHHIAMRVVNGVPDAVYFDGVRSVDGFWTGGAWDVKPRNLTNPLYMGAYGNGASPMHGALDESRISTVARSVDWIKTGYTNQANPALFSGLGAEVANTGGGGASTPAVYVTHYVNSAVTAAASLSATAGAQRSATSTMAAAASVTSSQQRTAGVVANLVGQAALSSGQSYRAGANVAISAASSLTAQVSSGAGVLILATSSLTAAAGVQRSSGAVVSGSSVITSSQLRFRPANAALSASSLATATAVGIRPASASITALSSAAAVGGRTTSSSASISSVSSLTAILSVNRSGSTTISSISSETATGSRARLANIGVAVQSSVTAQAGRATKGGASISALTFVNVATDGTQFGNASITAAASVSVTAVRVRMGAVTTSASSTATATAQATRGASTAIQSTSSSQATGTIRRLVSLDMGAVSSLAASAQRTGLVMASVVTTSTVSSTGVRNRSVSVDLSSAAAITADSIRRAGAVSVINVASTAQGAALRQRFAPALINALSTLILPSIYVPVLSVPKSNSIILQGLNRERKVVADTRYQRITLPRETQSTEGHERVRVVKVPRR